LAGTRSGGRNRKSEFSPDPGFGAGFPREPPETPKIAAGTEIWVSPGVTRDRVQNRVFGRFGAVFRENPDFWPGTRFLAVGTEIWVSPGVTQDRAQNWVFGGPEGVFRKNPDFCPETRFLGRGSIFGSGTGNSGFRPDPGFGAGFSPEPPETPKNGPPGARSGGRVGGRVGGPKNRIFSGPGGSKNDPKNGGQKTPDFDQLGVKF